MALPTDIRIGRKSLPGTNTVPYNEHSSFTGVKSFIKLTSGFQKSFQSNDRNGQVHLQAKINGGKCDGSTFSRIGFALF
jgi:hypothetical protein